MESEAEARLIEFCLHRQLERNPLRTDDGTRFLPEAGKQVDRFCVHRFIERDKDKLAVHGAVLMKKERHEVSTDDLGCYIETVDVHLKDIPLLFVWNADETRIESWTKQRPSQVIVAKDTPLGTTTVAAVREDVQLTILTLISAFGDSVPPLIVSKNQACVKHFLAECQLYTKGMTM
jgi:hypothetical protein